MTKFDVDYPHVRENADIVAVLAHYQVELNGEGEQRKGLCPFHDGERASLNVNVSRNLFKCHACGSGGNIIKLVQLLDPELKNPRLAALQVAMLSGISPKPNGTAVPARKTVPKEPVVAGENGEPVSGGNDAEHGDGRVYNRPLTFALQLSPVVAGEDSMANRFIEKHGISYERLPDLGIGMAVRGSMGKRLAIPIRNQDNELVAYCGLDIGLLEDTSEPTYKFPPKFHKELELYGWDVAQYFDRVVLVADVLPVIKYGGASSKYGDTGFGVASIMGTNISDEQLALLAEAASQVIVAFDGDEAGRETAPQVAGRIAESGLWVKVHRHADGHKSHEDDIETFCRRFGEV
ncbi:MAG: hypothetical protein APF80_13420 [Alphaproteobacteria bacterium BRH_c36]|nr:MAG: hypothetical protein APF80_13420 [Alphaproteobacteria bacterium BRH_c36]